MEKDIYTEGFFNLTDDNIYKSMVIKDIDSNIGQLLKTDAKFYATHVSPSEKELRAMGSTEKEQAEAMKRYIREVFIPEYAKNFNKELSASDIKFYGKIHFNRSRSDNELNMHCHLIVSRKDQSNKKKLSPLTNHKNTKNGVIKGGFDRVNLFQQAEQGFDKLFNYNRQLSEAFEYYNIMKNSTITNKLRLQKREQNTPKQNFTSEKKDSMQICKHTDKQADMIENIFTNQQENNLENKYDSNSTNFGLSSLFSTLLSTTDINSTDKQQELITKKKKKQRPRLI
ncbi:putative mobilization protein B [Bacteroides fragilis str. 1009-4-F |nr:putative mobilization protein B [Bacteroides fragilis str. 1009-4-F \